MTCQNNKNPLEWKLSNNERAVAVVIHGLNLNPDRMDSIINFYNSIGISTLKVRLKGHRGRFQDFINISYEIWLKEIETAFIKAKQYIKNKKIPLILSGFSIGALTGLNVTAFKNNFKIDAAIFFAPAIIIRKRSRVVLFFNKFGNDFVIPSRSPANYKANKGIPITGYNALFELEDKLKSMYDIINIPTLCFIDKGDEIVDARGLKNLVKTHNLNKWQLINIKKDRLTSKHGYRHLIIDPDSIGQKSWNIATEHIKMFVNKLKFGNLIIFLTFSRIYVDRFLL